MLDTHIGDVAQEARGTTAVQCSCITDGRTACEGCRCWEEPVEPVAVGESGLFREGRPGVRPRADPESIATV